MNIEQSLSIFRETEELHSSIAIVNGIKMGWLDFGAKSGVPLVWAHGSCLTSYEILNVQEGLVRAGYRVIAIDYRGHGKTQVDISENNTSLYHIADDINALMDYLCIDKAIIGGLSKGGWVATAFFDAYPDRVLGLLLEDGGSFSNIELEDDIRLGLVQAAKPLFNETALRRLYEKDAIFNTLTEAVNIAFSAFSPAVKNHNTVEFVVLLISLFKTCGDSFWRFHCPSHLLMRNENLQNNNGGLVTPYSRLPIMQRSQELMLPKVIFRNLTVPIHIIDPVSPKNEFPVESQNHSLAIMHPKLVVHELYEYEYSPHGAHFERPERFVESAKSLLSKVKSGSL